MSSLFLFLVLWLYSGHFWNHFLMFSYGYDFCFSCASVANGNLEVGAEYEPFSRAIARMWWWDSRKTPNAVWWISSFVSVREEMIALVEPLPQLLSFKVISTRYLSMGSPTPIHTNTRTTQIYAVLCSQYPATHHTLLHSHRIPGVFTRSQGAVVPLSATKSVPTAKSRCMLITKYA